MELKTANKQPLLEVELNLGERVREVQESGQPLFMTVDEKIAGVLLSPDTYAVLLAKVEDKEIEEDILESEREIDAGLGQDAEEAMREIAAEFGLRLKR